MTRPHPFDTPTLDQLRAAGGLKWTAFPDCIGAFVAEMDVGTAPAVTAALREAVDQQRFGYLPDHLLRTLGEACAQFQATRHGWQITPDQVRVAPDVLGALELVLQHYVPPGAPVVVPTPCYMPFLPLLQLHGHPAVQVPMRVDSGQWRFDEEALDAAFAGGARFAILCNPHNPTGRVHPREELQRFAAIAERHGARVFADEIHAPLVLGGHRHIPYASVSEAAAAHAITAVSASKAWNLPGLKCAQLIFTRADDLDRWRRMGPLAGHATSTPGVVASIAAWRDGIDWLDRLRAYLEGNRDLLTAQLHQHLPQVGCIPAQGTYLAWLDCRRLQLPGPPHLFFREQAKVAMTGDAECGDAGKGFARFTFAMPRPLLVEAVARMAGAVSRRGR